MPRGYTKTSIMFPLKVEVYFPLEVELSPEDEIASATWPSIFTVKKMISSGAAEVAGITLPSLQDLNRRYRQIKSRSLQASLRPQEKVSKQERVASLKEKISSLESEIRVIQAKP